jgi:hypothetical protein
MRSTLPIAFLATLFLATSCSRYDRELLGEPEPAPSAGPAVTEEAPPAAEDSLGVGMFDELRYYGQWYWIEPYGWVWRPSVISEWQPFVHGHWIWSQYGWMWVDYDPWGWATCHYGYWTTDFTLGWIWIPDYTWSPVQCDWLIYDDYVCWSPVAPPGAKFKQPWEGEQAWVSVPVHRFKDANVGDFRTTPKFKSDSPEIARVAPDVRDIERRGPRFSVIEVQLDRRVVGEREFARVKFPPDQEQIIERQRARVKNNSTSARFVPAQPPQPTPSHDANSGTVDQGRSNGTKARPRDNGAEKKVTKYKEKKSDEKKDDKSKDESNSGKKKG